MKSINLTLLMTLIVSTINAAVIVSDNNTSIRAAKTIPTTTSSTKTIPNKPCPTTGLYGVLRNECEMKGGVFHAEFAADKCHFNHTCITTKTISSKTVPPRTSTKTTSSKTLPSLTSTKTTLSSTSTKTIPSSTSTSTKTVPTTTSSTKTILITKTLSNKSCPTDGAYFVKYSECVRKGGRFYGKYDNVHCSVNYVCLIECSKNTTSSTKKTTSSTKTLPSSTNPSKTIPLGTKTISSSTKAIPSSTKAIPSSTTTTTTTTPASTGSIYCSCSINGRMSYDMKECEEMASVYGYVKSDKTTETCIPNTVTVTEKVKETVTVKTTVTVTLLSEPSVVTHCAEKWAQCGGIGFNGPTCCKTGTCQKVSDYYSQCI